MSRTQEGMTNNAQARVAPGVPSGGEFTAVGHSDNVPALDSWTPPAQSTAEIFAGLDDIDARFRRLEQQKDALDKIRQAHALRAAAATVQAMWSDAAVLRIEENQEGENQYDLVSIARADGSLIELSLDDDEWGETDLYQNGQDLKSLIYALDMKDESWGDGIATFHGNKRYTRMADINLAAARTAPIPFIESENNPRTRTLNEDEQADLVEAAYHGVVAIDDILENPNSFDEHRQFAELEDLKGRVNTLLTVTKKPE
jgi:hypothetical protein